MTGPDIPVQCTRCRNKHMESTRVAKPSKVIRGLGAEDLCCPRCGCRSYYDMRPQVAWCWASGLIEIAADLPGEGPNGSGAIEIARGPKAFLKGALAVLARHGRGASDGLLLVPGVPEAESQKAKADALGEWLRWCSRGKRSDGVTFSRMTS